MAQHISEDTQVKLDLKTIVMIIGFTVTMAGVWFTLKADIALAKELPKPEINRAEYDLKDQLIRETIENTAKQVEQNGEKLDVIEERLYEISKSK